jgi:L-ribulokinase
MAEHGVRIDRVINAGGIPQKSEVLNKVYANVLNKPVLVPAGIPTSLGSGIFALLAAGAYKTIEEAQAAVCLPLRTVEPNAKEALVYERLYQLYRDVYFGLGTRDAKPVALGRVLPELRKIAAEVRKAG